jgi:hypothetical protein
MKLYPFSLSIFGLSLIFIALTQAATSTESDSHSDDVDEYQESKDAIAVEWKKICDAGCQPGTQPDDAAFLSDVAVSELIALQYKPNCTAAAIHSEYYREIFKCSGRRDLCEDVDSATVKCRAKVADQMKKSFGQLGDSGVECERDVPWQDDYWNTALQLARHFYNNICLGGDSVTRECYLRVCVPRLDISRLS